MVLVQEQIHRVKYGAKKPRVQIYIYHEEKFIYMNKNEIGILHHTQKSTSSGLTAFMSTKTLKLLNENKDDGIRKNFLRS